MPAVAPSPSFRVEETPGSPQPYRFTVDEYYRMGAAGIFSESDRVELLDGQIVMMPPIDPGHAEGTHNSEKRLDRILDQQCSVRCQHPVRLGPNSEPVPDVTVVKLQSYKDRHPTPADTYLIIEVANSSLAEDLKQALPLRRSGYSGILGARHCRQPTARLCPTHRCRLSGPPHSGGT